MRRAPACFPPVPGATIEFSRNFGGKRNYPARLLGTAIAEQVEIGPVGGSVPAHQGGLLVEAGVFQVQRNLPRHINHPVGCRGKQQGGDVDPVVVPGHQHKRCHEEYQIGQHQQNDLRR